MKKQLKKLEKLGMSPKQAMLFLRKIAHVWYYDGSNDMSDQIAGELKEIPSFDTQFNAALAKETKKKTK